MRVLLTGTTGFVGSWLADYILENHPEVELYGMKRWRSPMENIRHIADKIKLIDGDLRDLSSMLLVIQKVRPDWIFHIAAQSYVPYSYSAPTDTLMTNTLGTLNLLEAVRQHKPFSKVHICSSSEVYGQVRQADVPIRETYPLCPASPYGVSKVGEDALAWMYYDAYKIHTVRSRAFTHTGPRHDPVFCVPFFAWQIARIEKGLQKPVIRVGYLDSVRTFCDVRDMVRAYWLLMETSAPGEVYNIGGNETMTVGDMLKLMLSLTEIGNSVKTQVDPKLLRPADVTLQVPDCSKFKGLTEWEPKIKLSQTLLDTLNFWRGRV